MKNHKIWMVVSLIDETTQITPSGKPCRIDPSDGIWSVMSGIEADYVFEKLASDEKVIKLIGKPRKKLDHDDVNANCYVFEVLESFKDYRDRLYVEQSFGLDKISDGNFLKVYDVVLDIKEALELTNGNQVEIRLLPNIVKFPGLMPADTIGLRDDYAEYRYSSAQFLKKIGTITHFNVEQGMHRWDSTLRIWLNRYDFDQYYEKMSRCYRETFGKSKSKAKTIQLMARPTFDKKESKIVFNDKECPIPTGTVEYYICQMTFDQFGEKIPEMDIIEAAGITDRSKTVYDAHRRLNDKVAKSLGINELLEFKTGHVWIRKELFDDEEK